MSKSIKYMCRLMVALCVPMLPITAAAGIFDDVVVRHLDNGMKVILMENHKAPVITFHVWYRTGARHDPWGKTGLAHVFEHMMFKGTKKISGAEFARIIQENGGQFNAFTSYDFAGYYATISADQVSIIMELEADRMQNLLMSSEDFRSERNVVMEERRLRVEDNPQALLAEQLNAAAFQATPYHWPVIGWMDDLKRLTLEDARLYYKTYYIPNNAFIVAVGDFDSEEIFQKVATVFGRIPAGEKPLHLDYSEPPQKGERVVNVRTDARQPAVLMGFHVPNIGHPDACVLEIIAALLSSGKSSRLYADLVLEKELALSANAAYSLLSADPDLFYLSGVPMRGKGVPELQAALLEQLERLKIEPVDDGELQKAKNQLETGFVFSQDSLFYQAMLLARYEIATGWEDIKAYLPAIRNVTAEDIRRVAAAYFVPQNRTVAILHPSTADAEVNAGPTKAPADGSSLGRKP
jgi:zinc protease